MADSAQSSDASTRPPPAAVESASRLILIPSYNTGAALLEKTVRGALKQWQPVWVVVDGSSDGSERPLLELEKTEPGLKIIIRPVNGGKGAAVQTGVAAALAAGYSHALLMDADGQHPASRIIPLMEASEAEPGHLIMGDPQFGPEAPVARLKGRKLTIWWTDLETCRAGLGDTLFGMRVYPLEPLDRVFRATRWARGFDFDPEAAVRLFWMGVPPRQVSVPCRYLGKEEGGVSQFNYLRDNMLLIWLHFRLMPEWLLLRWPKALRLKRTMARQSTRSGAPQTTS